MYIYQLAEEYSLKYFERSIMSKISWREDKRQLGAWVNLHTREEKEASRTPYVSRYTGYLQYESVQKQYIDIQKESILI